MKVRFCLSLVAIAISSNLAVADESADTTVPNTERMQVQGERLSPPKADTVTVTVDAASISKNLSNDIGDVLRHEPGVSISRDERFGIGSISIRGLDGNRVKLAVDGVELADSYGPSGSYLLSGRNAVDMDALQQLAIGKGGDISAGSGAMGGVVQFRTKQAADFLEVSGDAHYLSLAANYRSDSERFSETATYANRTGALESLLLYTRRDGHELENYGGGEDSLGVGRGAVNPGDNSANNLLGKFIWNASNNNRIGLVTEYFDGASAIDLRSESATGTRHTSDDELKRQRIGLFQTLENPSALYDQLRWQLDYQRSKTTNGTHVDSSSSSRYVDRFYQQQGWQGKITLAKQLADHQLNFGANYQYQQYENLNRNTVDGETDSSRFSPQATGNIAGVYLADDWQILPSLTLLPAVRYDHVRYSTEADEYIDDWGNSSNSKLTGQLGVNWQLAESLALFGRYGSGFRAPAMTDLYYYYESTVSFGGRNLSYIIRPNPQLKPEESTFTEAGLRWQGAAGYAEFTWYDNHYRDFIESQVSLGASAEYSLGEYTALNLGKVRIHGVELRSSIALPYFFGPQFDGLHLDVAFATATGDNQTDDEPLDSVAPMQAVSSLRYEAADANWGSELTAIWTAEKKTADISSDKQWLATAGFTVVDLTAFYKPMAQLQLTLGVFNLLDKQYLLWNDIRNLSNSSENLYRQTQPGRNVGLGISYRFL